LDLVARRAPRYLGGVLCLAVAAIAAHWILVVEPAVLDEPDVLARIQRLGASVSLPPQIPAVVAVLGPPVFVPAPPPRPPPPAPPPPPPPRPPPRPPTRPRIAPRLSWSFSPCAGPSSAFARPFDQ